MAQNEHKKDLRQLSEAYQNVIEGFNELEIEDAEGAALPYEKVSEGDHLAEAIKEMIKTFLDDDEFEGGLEDAFDLTIEQIGDSLGYYTIDNIGLDDDNPKGLGGEPNDGKWHGARDASLEDQGWHAPQE